MGLEYPAKSDAGYFRPNPNFRSLDALIPVWEKLGILPRFMKTKDLYHAPLDYKYQVALFGFNNVVSYGLGYSDNVKEAACLATAKAIKELKEENNG